MAPKCSVQMIVGERTEYGRLLLQVALESMSRLGYGDEFILVNNDSSSEARATMEMFKRSSSCRVCILDAPGERTFCDLRNLALSATGEGVTTVHWYDADEAYAEKALEFLKRCNEDGVLSKSSVRVQFIHFLPTPEFYQFLEPRIAVFPYHKGLVWEGGVHEGLSGREQAILDCTTDQGLTYFHFGYTKMGFLIALRWVHYAVLEHGHAGTLKEENVDGEIVPYFRDWRTPDTIIQDRWAVAHPFVPRRLGVNYPEPFVRLVLRPWRRSGLPWNLYLESIDPGPAEWMRSHRALVQSGGSTWKDWVDEVVKEEAWRLF